MEWWWTFRLLGVTDRSWDSCWAYVGPFRGYVGDKRSAQKLHTQLLARKHWGWRLTCLAYVGACGGFVRLLGLSLAIWGCQLGPCWSYVWACIAWFGALPGTKINSKQTSGIMLGQNGVFIWVFMLTAQMNTPVWAMLRLYGVHCGNPFFLEIRMQRQPLNIIWYDIESKITVPPLSPLDYLQK